MGYGLGPGMGKPGKKPVQEKPAVKHPVQQKPHFPSKKRPNMPPLPFDLGKFFGNKWK